MTTVSKKMGSVQTPSQLKRDVDLILDADLDEPIPAVPDLTSFEQSIELLAPVQIKINRLMNNVGELIAYADAIRQRARLLSLRCGGERIQ